MSSLKEVLATIGEVPAEVDTWSGFCDWVKGLQQQVEQLETSGVTGGMAEPRVNEAKRVDGRVVAVDVDYGDVRPAVRFHSLRAWFEGQSDYDDYGDVVALADELDHIETFVYQDEVFVDSTHLVRYQA